MLGSYSLILDRNALASFSPQTAPVYGYASWASDRLWIDQSDASWVILNYNHRSHDAIIDPIKLNIHTAGRSISNKTAEGTVCS